MDELVTIKENAQAEITIKKSKFIAEVFYVETEKQAQEMIQKVTKREYNAKHHCYCYRILEDTLLQKMSDDGEPSGTAGSPLLTILQGKNLINVLIVVTRYFGGILLGTGGLVRAYSESAIEALRKAETKKIQKGAEIFCQVEYADLEKIKYYLKQINGKIATANYEKKVELILQIPKVKVEDFTKSYQKLPFKIENQKIVAEKFVDI